MISSHISLESISLSMSQIMARAWDAAAHCAANASEIDYDGAFPTDEFQWISDAGLLGVVLREDLGGQGLGICPGSTASLLSLLRTFGYGSLPVGRLFEGHVNALLLLQMFGTPTQQRGWAHDVLDGRLFSVWNTQGEDGLRLAPLGGGRYRLEGAKTFSSGAQHVTRPLVTAALPDGGWQMCILPMEKLPRPISDPSAWHPLGMRATASVHTDFTGLEITRDDLLGAPGDYYKQPQFGAGSIRFCAVQLGGADAILQAVRQYLKDMGRIDDPYHRARVGQMATLTETGALWLQRAAALFDDASATPEQIVEYANMTRGAIETTCLDTMRLAERCVGARGLLRPHPLERIHRDLTLYLRQAGVDAAQSSVGRYVLESDLPPHALWSTANT